MINEELANYINTPNWNCPAFYEDDDEEYTIAITPVLPTKEPDNSFSMGDEHLSTIPETKLDELIKSSVENLVPIPSESEDFSDIEISSSKFDSLLEEFSGEVVHIDLISLEIDEADFDPEEEIRLSFSPSPILVEGSDSRIEEIDIFLTPDDSMPLGIENDDYDSEGDILFLEELLSNDSPSLPENESFHFDVPLSPRPPAKPPDNDEIEPDTRVLTAKVVGGIFEHYVLMPRLLPTQTTLCPVIDTLLPFSSKNEDKVYLLSHHGLKAFQLFSESSMMIYGGNIPTLDVLIAPDYEASRAYGFVIRSLELRSFA
ncbi:hypothetical protein Tco_0122022 [Tanacetum coccineum]